MKSVLASLGFCIFTSSPAWSQEVDPWFYWGSTPPSCPYSGWLEHDGDQDRFRFIDVSEQKVFELSPGPWSSVCQHAYSSTGQTEPPTYHLCTRYAHGSGQQAHITKSLSGVQHHCIIYK